MREFINNNTAGFIITLMLAGIAQYVSIMITLNSHGEQLKAIQKDVVEVKLTGTITREEQLLRTGDIQWVREKRKHEAEIWNTHKGQKH